MAKLSNKIRRQLANSNPKLSVDLEAMFDKTVPDQALRLEIGQALIDKILERTESSRFLETRGSKSGSAFRYTDAYISSIEFRVFGKSATRVNLRASGDMLRAMDIVDSSDDSILGLGFDELEEAEKAHGHITGNVGKMRDFFGLPEADVSRIRKDFQDRVDDLHEGPIPRGEEQRDNEDNLDFLLRIFASGQASG